MGPLIAGTAALAIAGGAAVWCVRGKSSSVLAPSVWRGRATRRAIALTFDDGPTAGTERLLEVLRRNEACATFFMCGHNVALRPFTVRHVLAEGHEIGNHTYTHPRLWTLSPAAIASEVEQCQTLLTDVAGTAPRWLRAPYGVRWFGLRSAQQRHGLTGVMWTAIARDWKLDAGAIVQRMLPRATPGAIWCFHDGRVLAPDPDISQTVNAVAVLLPRLRADGWEFTTIGDLVGIQ